MEKILNKLVWVDGERNKVMFGYIVSEDDFFIFIESNATGEIIKIGKRFIVSLGVPEVHK